MVATIRNENNYDRTAILASMNALDKDLKKIGGLFERAIRTFMRYNVQMTLTKMRTLRSVVRPRLLKVIREKRKARKIERQRRKNAR